MGSKTNRMLHFELLRILLMMMIVGLHALYFGGPLTKLPEGRTLVGAYGIESLFIPAVNCFVLISGYFSIDSTFRWRKFFALWGQILFYSLLFSGLYFIGIKEVPSLKDVVAALCPIFTQRWWFPSAFLPLYLVSGYLNKLLGSLTQREYLKLLAIGFVLFVLWSSLHSFSLLFFPLVNADGYSFVFFVFLYAVGGYLKRFPLPKVSPFLYFLGYLGCAGATWLLTYQSFLATGTFDRPALFFGYDTLWVFGSALFLFLCFSQLRVKGSWIGQLSSLTFGVYLIHEHPHVRPALYKLLGWTKNFIGIEFLVQFCFSVLVVFFGCIIIEWLRINAVFRPASSLLSLFLKKESRSSLPDKEEAQVPHERINR